VYLAISALRRELNGVPPFEPQGHDDFGSVLDQYLRISGTT
jgi:hypothetical protein